MSPSYQFRHLPNGSWRRRRASQITPARFSSFGFSVSYLPLLPLTFNVRLVRTTRLSIIPRNPKKAHHHLLVGGSPLSIYDGRIMPNHLCVRGVLWTNKIGDLLFISLVDRLRILLPNHPLDSHVGPFVNVRSSVATAFCIFWICVRSLAPSRAAIVAGKKRPERSDRMIEWHMSSWQPPEERRLPPGCWRSGAVMLLNIYSGGVHWHNTFFRRLMKRPESTKSAHAIKKSGKVDHLLGTGRYLIESDLFSGECKTRQSILPVKLNSAKLELNSFYKIRFRDRNHMNKCKYIA